MNQDDFHKLCHHPLFAGLSPPELAEIRRVARGKGFPARTRILTAGERCSTVCLILSGSVKLLIRYDEINRYDGDEDEDERLVSVLSFGDFIGAISLLSGGQQAVSAQTVEATRVAILEAEDFLLVLEKYPLISRNLNTQLAHMVQQLSGHSLSLSTLDVPGRLAFQLLRFARQHGQCLTDGTTLIGARLTQNDLAHLCGASREQINRILKTWQRQGLVSKRDKNFLISNSVALERLAR